MEWRSEAWRERRDNQWTAGCRWQQSWWRDQVLAIEPGPHRVSRPDRLVASMLPPDAEPAANFLSRDAAEVAERLMSRPGGAGIVDADRLRRNLMASQPVCVNLFGPYVSNPNGLLAWVRSLDSDAVEVTGVAIEHAPPRDEHFGGGSAFDAFVEYRSESGLRFFGIETKYAEDLRASNITVRDVYREYTEASGEWLEGAERRLDVPYLRQFWLNLLLAQSLAARGDRYERGTGIVIACAADRSAEQATQRVRLELHDPDRWLLWVPYEHVLPHLEASWVADFRRRYLDFTPVADLLAADDLRVSRSQPESWLSGIADARALAERVCGEGSVLAQILEAHSEGRLRSASSAQVEALDARAAELAVDLRTIREAAYQLWSQIDHQDRA